MASLNSRVLLDEHVVARVRLAQTLLERALLIGHLGHRVDRRPRDVHIGLLAANRLERFGESRVLLAK